MRYLFLFLFSVSLSTHAQTSSQHLYLASKDEVTVFGLHADSGKLTPHQTIPLSGAGPFTFSHDGKRLFAMAKSDDSPQIATFERQADGRLSLIHQADIRHRGGYISVDQSGHYLASNHYREGKVSLWKLKDGAYHGTTAQELTLEPRVHSAIFSPDNRWLLVPATLPNKVFVQQFDPKQGTITPNKPAFGAAPMSEDQARHPRHLVFHPKLANVLYTTNESKQPGVGVWQWDSASGTLKPIQNLITLQPELTGNTSTADLHITPNARYLYSSNRNKTGGSSIVGFQIDPTTGLLELIGHTPCENVPRSFCIDQTGRYVYVAGQLDAKLGVYTIVPSTGRLQKIEQHTVGNGPNWVETR